MFLVPVPNYLFPKVTRESDERLGRAQKSRFSFGLPLRAPYVTKTHHLKTRLEGAGAVCVGDDKMADSTTRERKKSKKPSSKRVCSLFSLLQT